MTETMKKYKIALCGEQGVGKSCIALQFSQRSFSDDYEQSNEISEWYTKQIELDDHTINVDVVDINGNEAYKTQRQKIFESCNGFIFVYSCNNVNSFKMINEWYQQVKNCKSIVPAVLCASKIDLQDIRLITTQQGQELANQFGNIPYFETSAKKNINIEIMFVSCIREIQRLTEKVEDPYTPIDIFDTPCKRCKVVKSKHHHMDHKHVGPYSTTYSIIMAIFCGPCVLCGCIPW